MADNAQGYRDPTTQTTSLGTFAFDECTINAVAALVARTKIGFGADGTYSEVASDNPFPVYLASAGTLPADAATATLQTAGNGILTTIDADTGNIATSVASIDTKTPALGQALAAASVPVVLTAAQLTTLTPPAAITGFATESTLGTLSAKFAGGTVIGDVNLGATDNAVLDAIAASLAGTLTVGSHAVTNAGTFAVQATLQAGTAGIGKLTANSGVTIGAVEIAAAQTLATVTTVGAVTAITNALPSGTNNIGDVDVLTLPGAAHDAGISGNPVRVGARAETLLSGITLVSDGDTTDLYAGVDGVIINRPHTNLEDIVSGVAAITDGSSTSVIASAGAGIKVYITSVIIANSSATAVTVDLRDGAAGTVKATLPVPANTGGVVTNFPVPLPFSAATAVCADPSAAASTVTVTLIGFRSKV